VRALPSLDIYFTIRVEGEAPDLPFLGPTVRGLLGYGLRQTCCGHDADDDGRCRMGDTCNYAYLFEGPLQQRMKSDRLELDALPQPFIPLVDPPFTVRKAQQRITFGVRLLGAATGLASEVATAIIAREPFGFGSRSKGFSLESVGIGGAVVWTRNADPAADELQNCVRYQSTRSIALPAPRAIPTQSCTLHWKFATPLALGAPIGNADNWARRLLDAATRRRWLLERAYQAPSAAPHHPPRSIDTVEFATRSVKVEPFRFERRSTRHGGLVVLNGMIGSVSIHGPWHRHADLLSAVDCYGAGQFNSFGFGQVLTEVDHSDEYLEAVPTRSPRALVEPPRIRSNVPRWVRLRGVPPPKPIQ
jgi:hypothetical protein